MYDFSKLAAALHKAGKSLTTQREELYIAFLNEEPLSMGELIKKLQGYNIAIDRASIYRGVALFERLGIVQRLQIGWKYKLELSNNFQDHHHHLTCTKCGKIIPLGEDPELENRLTALARAQNFQPEDHQLEIRGLCASCVSSAT